MLAEGYLIDFAAVGTRAFLRAITLMANSQARSAKLTKIAELRTVCRKKTAQNVGAQTLFERKVGTQTLSERKAEWV